MDREKRDTGNPGTNPDSIRNVGIVAHIDAGKTTLTERILFATREIRTMGDVHDGTTVTDWTRQERERGISINAAAVNCRWKQWQINVVDTPGHIDFTAEVERSLCVMDGIVAVFCAVKGVQAQSETVWRCAARHKLPALAFVNKMDREGADPDRVVEEIGAKLGVNAVPVQFPVTDDSGFLGTVDLLTGSFNGAGKPDLSRFEVDIQLAQEYLLECLAEADDIILQEYLSGRRPGAEMLAGGLRRAVCRRQVVPVFFGSSLENRGVEELLDGAGRYLPSSMEADKVLECREGSNAVLVFRAASAVSGMGRLLYVRVCSGSVHAGLVLGNPRTGLKGEITRVLKVQASEVCSVESAGAGDIVALQGTWTKVRTGDVLSDDPEAARLEKLDFPQPVVSLNLEALDSTMAKELGLKLKSMSREDPTLKVKPVPASQAWTISGMGELHLEIIRERLDSDFGIRTRCGSPRVEYLTAVSDSAVEDYVFEKHFPGGAGICARVCLQVEPLERGQGIKLDLASLKAVPGEVLAAVKRGLMNVVNAENSGFPLTDTKVTVLSASCQPEESGEAALLSAARSALENALQKAGTVILEPLMRVEVNTPGDTLGAVLADLNSRHSGISLVDTLPGGYAKIVAVAPLAELFGYASSLRSMSAGRGEVVAEPSHYGVRATH